MIKLENVVLASPEQMEFIIEGMRNPMNSWDKSDSGYRCGDNACCLIPECDLACDIPHFIIGENDHNLMMQLSDAGTDHRKYMRMMPVYVRIKAPLYWWKEFDTYKVGTVANSCSTMHKIQEKEFTTEDFSCEHLLNTANNDAGDAFFLNDANNIRVDGDDLLCLSIHVLNHYRERYLQTKDKRYWWQMIQLLPSSYNQTRNVMLNYEVLTNIYHARKNHKLDEWRKFCGWIESLPYSELITGGIFKVGDKVKYVRKGSIYYGKEGYIVEVEPEKIARVQIPIQLTSGDGFTTIPCSFDNLKPVENKEE